MTENKQNNKESNEVLSFEALTAEDGDINMPVKEIPSTKGDDAPATDSFREMGGTNMGDGVPDEKTPEDDEIDRLNSHILTGCSPATRHMYVEGIFCGILASLFMAPIILRTGFVQYQPWFSYFSMALAVGATVWSLSGWHVETKTAEKRMSIISALFCMVVAVVAFLFRMPPG